MQRHLISLLSFLILLHGGIAQDNCISKPVFENLKTTADFHSQPDTLGVIRQKEISGIAPSLRYPHHLWGISDSGNGAVLHLYNLKDASLKKLFILKGIANVDWEDLSIEITETGEAFLYIPDFGDNQAKRKSYTIYKIPEPEIIDPNSKINTIPVIPESFKYTYLDGAKDAEALAFDPVEKALLIISKREENVLVYSLPMEERDSIRTLSPLGRLPISNVVAADFSVDGRQLLLKTYTNVYLWKRQTEKESVCEMLSRPPQLVSYQLEPQGESITFVQDGFITVSEERFGITPRLYRYGSQSTD